MQVVGGYDRGISGILWYRDANLLHHHDIINFWHNALVMAGDFDLVDLILQGHVANI